MNDGSLIVGHEGQAILADQALEAVAEAVAHPAGDLAGVGALDLLNGRVACKTRQGIGRQSAAHIGAVLAGGQTRRHELSILPLAAYAACGGIAARHDLAENRQIRHHIEVALGAGEGYSEAGDHLVEDHQRAVPVTQRPDTLVIFVSDGAGAALGANRLHDDGCRAAPELVAPEHALQHVEVVGADFVGGGVGALGDAVGLQQGAAAGDLQAVDHLVRPAVIRAADLNDALFPRGDAGDAQGGHHRLGAGAKHAEHLHIGHVAVDFPRDEHFRLVEQTRNGAAFVEQLKHLFPYDRIVAAQDGGAAGLQEVDVLVAVLVVEVSSLGFGHTHGKRLVEGQIVLDAAGDILLRLLIYGAGLGALLVIILQNYIVIVVVRHLPNGLIGECLELGIDLLRIVPSADAAIIHAAAPFLASSSQCRWYPYCCGKLRNYPTGIPETGSEPC